MMAVGQLACLGDMEAGVSQPISVIPELHRVSGAVRPGLGCPLGAVVAGEAVDKASKSFALHHVIQLGA